MNLKHILLSVLLCGTYASSFAQLHANEIGIQSDNDSFLAQGSDRYYTNGIFIYYRHALSTGANEKLKNKVLGFELGQKIFNPISGNIPDKSYVDRPFAGYLYAGANLNYLYSNESNLKLGVQAGIVGPGSLGQEAQQVIHDTFGFYELQGWQYQIRNNAQLNLSGEYNSLITRGSAADLSFNSYANLGTGFTGAGAGVQVRLGNFNQLFNSVSTQSTAIQKALDKSLHDYELFFYYKPMLNYIAYDATVQGSLFTKHDDTEEITATPNRLMLSQQAGVAYGGKRWILNAAVTFNTKDVKGMMKSHQWGSLSALYRFN